jgi:hypothetical protein
MGDLHPAARASGATNARAKSLFYVWLFVGYGLLVTLCHPGQAFPAAIGEICGARDWVEGAWSRFRQSASRVTGRACLQAAIVVGCLPKFPGGDKLS